MRDKLQVFLQAYQKYKLHRYKLLALLLVISLVVFGNVFWQLRHTGITMANDAMCGIIEHTHTDTCIGYEVADMSSTDIDNTELFVLSGSDVFVVSGTDACSVDNSIVVSLTDISPSDMYCEVYKCGHEEHVHAMTCYSDNTLVETDEQWTEAIPFDKLTGVWADDLIKVAESQLGYTESERNFTLADDNVTKMGYTRYGHWYNKAQDNTRSIYGNWDATFVSFCLNYAGVPEDYFPYSSGAYSWSVFLKELELFYDSSEIPFAGDLIFFDRNSDGNADNVGIVSSVFESEGIVRVIEGNSDHAVKLNSYTLDDVTIYGYGLLPYEAMTASMYDISNISLDGRTELNTSSVTSVTPIISGKVSYDKNTDTYFIVNFTIDFTFTPKNLLDTNGAFYYPLPEGIEFYSGMLGAEGTASDKGMTALDYKFVEIDGKHYILIDFRQEYYNALVSGNYTGGECEVYFKAIADGSLQDTQGDGSIIIEIPGSDPIVIPPSQIEYEDTATRNYDIDVQKKADCTDGTTANYTITVTSTKGTPTTITLKDDVSFNVLTKNGTNNVVPTIIKNVYSVSSPDTVISTETLALGDADITYNEDGTIASINLPQITNDYDSGSGEYTTITEYVITYSFPLNELASDTSGSVSNTATVTSEGHGEKVTDSSTDSIQLSNEQLSKTGYYDGSNVNWTIQFNSSQQNVAGHKITDDNFASALDSISITPADGWEYIYDDNSNITGILFNAVSDSENINAYTIEYSTAATDTWNRDTAKNTVYYVTPDSTVEDYAEVPVFNNHLTKTVLESAITSDDSYLYLPWLTTISIPASGISSGTVIDDTLSLNQSLAETHYITYRQLSSLALNTQPDGSGDAYTAFTIRAYYNYQYYTLEELSADTSLQDTKFTYFEIVLNEEISQSVYGNKLYLTYSSTVNPDYLNSLTTFTNTISSGDNSATGSYSYIPNVIKMNNLGNAYSTSTTNAEGYVTWKVRVTLDEAYVEGSDVKIVDKLPQNVDLSVYSIGIGFDGNWFPTTVSSDKIDADGNFTASVWSETLYGYQYVSGSLDYTNDTITVTIPSDNHNLIEKQVVWLQITCKVNQDMDSDGHYTGGTYTLDNEVDVYLVKDSIETEYGSDNHEQTLTVPKYEEPDSGDDSEDDGPTYPITRTKYSEIVEGIEKEQIDEWTSKDVATSRTRLISYSLDINPTATSYANGNTLTLTDTLTYTASVSANYVQVPQTFTLIHSSVKLYYAAVDESGIPLTDENGRLIPKTDSNGNKVEVSDWSYTYADGVTTDNWYISNIITANVPDSTALIFEYQYEQENPENTTENEYHECIYADNRAYLSYAGSDINYESYYYSYSYDWGYMEHGAIVSTHKIFTINKFEKGNYTIPLEGTVFALYKYNKETDVWSRVHTYTTDENGVIQIKWQDSFSTTDYQFEYNTAYYVVEETATNGYVLPKTPTTYTFFFENPDSEIDNIPDGDFKTNAINLMDSDKNVIVENEKNEININLEKTWYDTDGVTDITDKKTGSVNVILYQVSTSDAVAEEEELTYGDPAIADGDVKLSFADVKPSNLWNETTLKDDSTNEADYTVGYLPNSNVYITAYISLSYSGWSPSAYLTIAGAQVNLGSGTFIKSSNGYYVYEYDFGIVNLLENSSVSGYFDQSGNCSIYLTTNEPGDSPLYTESCVVFYVRGVEPSDEPEEVVEDKRKNAFTINAYPDYNVNSSALYNHTNYLSADTSVDMTIFYANDMESYGIQPFLSLDTSSKQYSYDETHSALDSGRYLHTYTFDSIQVDSAVDYTGSMANSAISKIIYITSDSMTLEEVEALASDSANNGTCYIFLDIKEPVIINTKESQTYTVKKYGEYTISSAEDWKKTIEKLPLQGKTADGKIITYSYYVKEESSNSYITNIDNISDDGIISKTNKETISLSNVITGQYTLVETGGSGTAWITSIALLMFLFAGIIFKRNFMETKAETAGQKTAVSTSQTIKASITDVFSDAKSCVHKLIDAVRRNR